MGNTKNHSLLLQSSKGTSSGKINTNKKTSRYTLVLTLISCCFPTSWKVTQREAFSRLGLLSSDIFILYSSQTELRIERITPEPPDTNVRQQLGSYSSSDWHWQLWTRGPIRIADSTDYLHLDTNQEREREGDTGWAGGEREYIYDR